MTKGNAWDDLDLDAAVPEAQTGAGSMALLIALLIKEALDLGVDPQALVERVQQLSESQRGCFLIRCCGRTISGHLMSLCDGDREKAVRGLLHLANEMRNDIMSMTLINRQ